MEAAVTTIRPARPADAADLCVLIGQLGYRMPEAELADRIARRADAESEAALVAADGPKVVGLIALSWSTMLHMTAPTARITTLVVGEEIRGRGVGRQLVEAGAALAREAGCAILELTTALQRDDARKFYEALGFTASSLRLHLVL